jgi:hypothetical protein
VKNYVVSTPIVDYVVRANSKKEAAQIVKNSLCIAEVPVSWVDKLPKKGIIFNA